MMFYQPRGANRSPWQCYKIRLSIIIRALATITFSKIQKKSVKIEKIRRNKVELREE
jgi:hypothetical protein